MSEAAIPAGPDVAENALINGRYAVLTAQPLPGAGGGLTAFVARDMRGSRGDLMAVQVATDAPPRAAMLTELNQVGIEGVLTPQAHGPALGVGGVPGYFVICQAPPGPSLAASGIAPGLWTEAALLDQVVRPVATALEMLRRNKATHRAIRPNNVFRLSPGSPVVLGCAWASPPGLSQPCVFEPPYTAICVPGGRGNGSVADDVYALGVLLVTLATGAEPMAGMSDNDIIQRKLDLGSFAAVVGDHRLAPGMIELVRGMLAEDPVHRPTAELLIDPAVARGRRLAMRQKRRAARPLPVQGLMIWEPRMLAYAFWQFPEEAIRMLRSGEVDFWLRRNVGDTPMATRLDEVVRHRAGESNVINPRADALMAVRAIALLDPLAPLCWQGIALWPDCLGPALVAARPIADVLVLLEEVVTYEAVGRWASARQELCDFAGLNQQSKQWRIWQRRRGLGGGLVRVIYELNPLMPCASPMLGQRWVARLVDLLPALEAVSYDTETRRLLPLDMHIAAFVAARQDARGGGDLGDLTSEGRGGPVVAHLRVLARLQMTLTAKPLPGVAAWLASHAEHTVASWHNRRMRERVAKRLADLVVAGQLTPIVALLDDAAAREADEHGLQRATASVAKIDAELDKIATGAPARLAQARRIGRDVAAGAGLLTLTAALAALLFG
jgi:hypothetical protein